MRVFLVYVGGAKPRIHAEVLSYDRTTNMMRVKCKNGSEYDRVFLPNSKYNRTDYQLKKETSDA